MAEQDNQHGSGSASSITEATQSKQTTRFQYPRGDAVIGEFFTANVYKSAALIDVIYLFHLDYGAGADVSQILRERLMQAARDNSNGSNTAVPIPPATKRTVDMPSETESDDAVSNETAEEDTVQQKTVEKKQQKAELEKQQDTATEQSNTDKKSSDFDIAEMFD